MLIEGKDYRFIDCELEIHDKDEWILISIDGYRQDRIISAGANGITILAFNETLNREVVIKVWKPRTDDFDEYEAKFKREIQKIASIDHPSIARIYDGQKLNNGYCYAIMEHIDGETFTAWRNSYFSLCNFEEKSVFMNLINALLAYQKHGIVHGDIHGGNILISNNSKVHIIDFGTSYPNKKSQSLKRELFLEFTSIISVLKKESFFNPNHFIIHEDNAKRKLIVDTEYRNLISLNPMLLTETLMSYAIIIGAMQTNRLNNTECIKALAFAIANSSYLNLENVLNDIITENVMNLDMFFRIFIPHIETAIYSDYQGDLYSFYCGDVLEVLSFQAYLEWNRDSTMNIEVTTEDKKIQELLSTPNIDAVDIYANHKPYLQIMRPLLMKSITKSKSNNIAKYLYYLNTSIREKLLDENLKEKFKLHNPKIDLESIASFFDVIHNVLNEDYEALV